MRLRAFFNPESRIRRGSIPRESNGLKRKSDPLPLSEKKWTEERLFVLADTAWRSREETPTSHFVLSSERLIETLESQDLSACLKQLYDHARRWSPGFEVPWCVPEVKLSRLTDAAGQYTIRDGFVCVELSSDATLSRSALLAILCHEACHHILDLSGLATRDPAVNEPLTDLAIFINGFGSVFLDGQESIAHSRSGWRSRHLGYLTRAHYELAQEWVLSVLHLRSAGDRFQAPPDAAHHWRKKVLNRLGGNEAALARLMAIERCGNPSMDELTALKMVSAQLERDSS